MPNVADLYSSGQIAEGQKQQGMRADPDQRIEYNRSRTSTRYFEC